MTDNSDLVQRLRSLAYMVGGSGADHEGENDAPFDAAVAIARLTRERDEAREAASLSRICLTCGRYFSVSVDPRIDPDDCPANPACTLTLTPVEAVGRLRDEIARLTRERNEARDALDLAGRTLSSTMDDLADAQAENANVRAILTEAVNTYGKPGGPWNIPSDPGGWLERARAALAHGGPQNG